MSHISLLGACWAQTYFEEIPNFGKVRPNFGEGQLAGKATRVRKSRMQRKKACKACMQENLTMLCLGFLSDIVIAKKLVN